MKLVQFGLENFRNHKHTTIQFSKSGNIIVGNNGEGKTNIIEAIACLCLTKSFYAPSDTFVTMVGETGYTVSGTFVSDSGIEYTAVLAYNREEASKTYLLNKSSIDPLSRVIGQFPVVILSPEHARITFGGPQERRKFVDGVLSQTYQLYLETLLEYRRILRQRNALLMHAREKGKIDGSSLEPWNEAMVQTGAYLIAKRKEFLLEFQEYLAKAYKQLTGNTEEPLIQYQSTFDLGTAETEIEISEVFGICIERNMNQELSAGVSLFGPHRDELSFSINGKSLRTYASQGQHKTFLVALKIAEFEYMKLKCNETPILLLDDVLSELDTHRATNLLTTVSSLGQFVLTSTEKDFLLKFLPNGEQWKILEVLQGTIRYAN